WPLRMLGMIVAQAQRAVVSAERVQEVLATDPLVADSPHPVGLPAARPNGGASGGPVGAVAFEGVRFSYGARTSVLDGFDLRVRPGESVALVGATGSGKTTVARLIPRFYDVEAGRITLDGIDVRDLRLRDLRRAAGTAVEAP